MRDVRRVDWELDGLSLHRIEADGPADPPVLYLHGVPTNGDDFEPFLERTGGFAPDLPGFGRSAKRADFDYSIDGYRRWLGRLVEDLGLERLQLVVHDWGSVGLALAQDRPELVERLVVIDAVPFFSGYRWHRIARLWRTPLVGELVMGTTTRWGFKQISREATSSPGPAPDDLIDRVWEHFDQGTQRAILKLYRSAPPDALERAGARLGELRCPALVLWGADDPYLATSLAQRFADHLGGPATVEVVEGANHWPWIDKPEVVDRVARFLLEGR
jgi:pimeloyl-ACP methyl ester carboxylesterase